MNKKLVAVISLLLGFFALPAIAAPSARLSESSLSFLGATAAEFQASTKKVKKVKKVKKSKKTIKKTVQ